MAALGHEDGGAPPFDAPALLTRFSALDVFPPGFVLVCPVCQRLMPPASEKGSAQLLQCQHRDPTDSVGEPTVQMAQDGKCYTINTRGVAFGGPNLKDLQERIEVWGRTAQGVTSLVKWKSSMTIDAEVTYWATLAENKRLVEAGAAQQAAEQEAAHEVAAHAASVGARSALSLSHLSDAQAALPGAAAAALPMLLVQAADRKLVLPSPQPRLGPSSFHPATRARPAVSASSTRRACRSAASAARRPKPWPKSASSTASRSR